jgi:hypothetical protein
MSASLKKMREQLREELKRSLLLEEADRQFWLDNLATLPLPLVQNLLAILVPRNARVDGFIETALAQDGKQEHLTSLRRQVAAYKKQAYRLEEKGQAGSEREEEERLLEQLDQQ